MITAGNARNRSGVNSANLAFSEDQLLATLCQKSYYRFVQEMWDVIVPEAPVWNWHIKEMCDRVQLMCERVFRNEPKLYDLITNVPPGMSKSLVHSVLLPAWCWTRMPSFRFIGASYSYPLAQELSVKTRDVVTSDKYQKLFPHITLREDQNTKGHFKTLQGGGRYAVGVNGSVTGFHAHLVMVDDPLDPNQASSPADLAASNRWLRETLPSRKVDKAVVPTVLVMQRLHQDDPTAQMRKRGGIFHLCLPATDEDTVRPKRLREKYQAQGGLLDPKRLPRQVLEQTEKEMGEVAYASQYRQRPTPAGGAMFKIAGRWLGEKTHVRDVSHNTVFKRFIRFWDKAGTEGGRGPFTCGVLLAEEVSGLFWVLDVVRFRLDVFGREKAILEQARLDCKRWGEQVTVGLEQEPGSGGKESLQATVSRLRGFNVWWWRVDGTTGGKELRSEPWATQVNAGNVVLRRDEAWNDQYSQEHEYFPNSRYKDQVDASAGAFQGLCGGVVEVGAMR